MSKYIVGAGSSAVVALCGVVALMAWVRARHPWPVLGVRDGAERPRAGWLLSPLAVGAVIATEVIAQLADRMSDRLRLDGVTETSRRDTLYVVAIAGAVGIVDDLVSVRRIGRESTRRLARGALWTIGFLAVAAPAIGGGRGTLVMAALVAAVSADAGAEIERRTPGLGIALFVVAAGVAALATDRSPQLAGLAVALGAAAVVALAAARRLGLVGAGTVGIAGAALAAGVVLDRGTYGVVAALVSAIAVVAATEVAKRVAPRWQPVEVEPPPFHPGGDHVGYADLP